VTRLTGPYLGRHIRPTPSPKNSSSANRLVRVWGKPKCKLYKAVAVTPGAPAPPTKTCVLHIISDSEVEKAEAVAGARAGRAADYWGRWQWGKVSRLEFDLSRT
jgi:hypothetical protein